MAKRTTGLGAPMRRMDIGKDASSFLALALLGTLLVGVSCGGKSQVEGDRCSVHKGHLLCGPAASGDSTQQTAEIYAQVVRRLVTKDDTFGGNAGFKRVFLLDAIVPRAGGSDQELSRATPLSSEVKSAMVRLLKDLPPLRFVSKPGDVIKGAEPNGSPGEVFHGGVLLTLGPISGTPKKVQVPNRLWISGLAGQWQVYVLQKSDGQWKIKGNTGVVGIS